MRHADMALYRAKNEGRNRACIYDSAMDADLVKRKLLENELRVAIENDGLHVAYQPIVNDSGEKSWSASRRFAAGLIPNAARFRPPNSFRSRSTAD